MHWVSLQGRPQQSAPMPERGMVYKNQYELNNLKQSYAVYYGTIFQL